MYAGRQAQTDNRERGRERRKEREDEEEEEDGGKIEGVDIMN